MSTEGLVKVTSVVVSLNGKNVELTPEQARRLRDELQELLGPRIPQYVPVYSAPLNPVWETTPIYCDPNSEKWPDHWSVKYGPLATCASLTIHA